MEGAQHVATAAEDCVFAGFRRGPPARRLSRELRAATSLVLRCGRAQGKVIGTSANSIEHFLAFAAFGESFLC